MTDTESPQGQSWTAWRYSPEDQRTAGFESPPSDAKTKGNQMAFDPDKIESRIDRAVTGAIEFDDAALGLQLKNLLDAMEFAKTMAISKQAIPMFMRNEPGICNAAVTRALRWRLDPYFVAENMYLTRNPKSGEEKIAFQSQLINAVINNAQALVLEGKLRVKYEGEGDEMRAIVYGIPKHETEPVEYRSPTLGERKRTIGRNEQGNLKGSPLYDQDPQQQLWYYASRAFIRRYFPHVLAGVYTGEELAEAGHERMLDVTPSPKNNPPSRGTSLMERLKAGKQAAVRGFDADYVERETTRANGGQTEERRDEAAGTTGGDSDEIRAEGGGADAVVDRGPDDAGPSDGAGPSDSEAGGGAASAGEADAPQQELIPPDDASRKAGKARYRR
jgi:hypothetical protein